MRKSPKISKSLGKRLSKENNKKNGVLGSILLDNLKRVGIDTTNKAKDKGLDALFKWFNIGDRY